MNYTLLTELFRTGREYGNMAKVIRSSLQTGRFRPVIATGLSDGAADVFLPALVEDFADMCILILTPEEKDAASTAALLQGAGLPALQYPARDYNFNNIISSHDYEHRRLRVLSSLLFDAEPLIITATPEAVLQITMPEELLSSLTVTIDANSRIDTEKLAASLSASGYVRGELVEGPGQFAVRGGIVDIYPPAAAPYRIELFGDEIDRIGTFDVQTQRFTETVNGKIRIPPAREVIVSAEMRSALSAAIRRQIKKLANSEGDHAHAAEVLTGELATLDAGLEIDFADKYLPLLYPTGTCLMDYFRGMLVIRSTQNCENKAEACATLLSQSITDMLSTGELFSVKQNRGYIREWDTIADGASVMPTVYMDAFTSGGPSSHTYNFSASHIPAYGGNMALLKEDLVNFVKNGYMCTVLCSTEVEEKEVLRTLADEGYTVAPADGARGDFFAASGQKPVAVLCGEFAAGFDLISPKFALLNFSAAVRAGGHIRRRKTSSKKKATEAILSYADLEIGDLVVHTVYGIGQYTGIENITVDGTTRDYITIHYAGTDKLFLPVDQLDMVSKYIGAGADSGAVKLSKMGGADWTRTKAKAKAATKEMAKELIALYAKRKRTKGIAFDPDDDMCRQFADAFEYEETEGQTAAIADIRRDMEASYPMDRLLCGDVGYGKTEVALRAAFKAVMSGYQVAVLVPTTILAFQHLQTFQSRLRGFPVEVDMLSRFRTPTQQAASLRKLRRGDTDIIIGTHRLISKDVTFSNLGLIIVDEEQRFGVEQKEKLKQIAPDVDVLTLTATPIPRTLNMAMGGIVDMSVLEEAPGLRSPVQTYVLEHDDGILLEAMRREMRRGGQVFYLKNRIESVYETAAKIARSLPDARVATAHGRMDRDELEEIWAELVKGEIDILVSTTIIETGIDVPNANTLIIENADRYGLSQLHQIRGRVGRSSRRAYAFLTYPRQKQLTEIAEKRLSAIKEYAAFGAGFKIALRDLEIRGAGNLLGAQQHGHMEAVGYDMYVKLLNEAVLEEQGETPEPRVECSVDIRCDAYLSKAYIPSAPQRMEMYRKIARITEYEDYEDILDELCDRFGEPPSASVNLCKIAHLRALGANAGMKKIEERDGILRLVPETIHPNALTALAAAFPAAQIRMALGGESAVVCRFKKGVKVVDFATELLTKYIQFR